MFHVRNFVLCVIVKWRMRSIFFFTYVHAGGIWQQVGLHQEVTTTTNAMAGFNGHFFHLLDTLLYQHKNVFAMMIWSIWRGRNEKLWEDVVQPYTFSIQSALELLHQWEQAKERHPNKGAAISDNNTSATC